MILSQNVFRGDDMITEIITTGTELLLGEIPDENGRWLSVLLNSRGYTVTRRTTVGDNPERLYQAIREALGRADLVITTGGLGSTQGDITKKAGSRAIGLPFELNQEESERLRIYYEEKHRPYSRFLDRQAWFCRGAELLKNETGSASGCAVQNKGKILIHLPGPPSEMKPMAAKQMIPWLGKNFGDLGIICSEVFCATGITESETERRILDLILAQSNPTIALLARPGYIAVRVTARADSAEQAEILIHPIGEEIQKRLPILEYHIERNALSDLIGTLKDHRLTISAAESCTGGLIGKLLTDAAGSSAYFQGSAVTYQDSAKADLLGVSTIDLKTYTAVSRQVASQMADGSRRLYKSDIAVSTTGYAGPAGNTEEPTGLVYIGISGHRGTEVHEEHFFGNRKAVRYAAAEKAIYHAWQYILKTN